MILLEAIGGLIVVVAIGLGIKVAVDWFAAAEKSLAEVDRGKHANTGEPHEDR